MATNPILIIDDEPSNLATLKQILKNDYPLAFARSGTEGLAAAEKHQPSLILLDIRMPDMDGYTVCRKLKQDAKTENIPVIFVSALGEVGDEAAGFECGGVDYIIKPVSPAIVRARVRTHLSLVRATMLERYVTQLEIQQQKIARLSRIKTLLSDINSVILRTRDRQMLFTEACRIAVEQGGFDTAWIVLAQGATMVQVARQGMTEERLNSLIMALPLQANGQQGVVHMAMGCGRPAFSNDIRACSDADQVCRDALDHGFLSLIALPLMPDTQATGAMVLYAHDAGYFDDEELKLLNELAGDISFAMKHIEQEERVNYLSFYDVLTGLPNNVLFLDRLSQIVQAAKHESGIAVMAIANLDRFKQVNDGLGRHAGDQVLKEVANRLTNELDRRYSITRLTGDSFAVAGTQTAADEVAVLVDQINVLLSQPMVIDGAELHLSGHVGVALYPSDGDDAETLFKNAEAALKQAKASNERYSYYSPELNARMAEKFELESLLRKALEQKQFVLYYQAKVDLASGRIAGAEALIRWVHPERGMVPPSDFIPLAEETGLIVPIGSWVIQSVCEQQAEWRAQQVRTVPIALNLSALQFRKGDVQESVQEALSSYGLAPNFVELELTETLVMQNLVEAERTMQAFTQCGLHLSLDDFGTGYSSLAYLKRFPFDTVKIDRTFVSDITTDSEDAAIASAIISMAHNLQMHVIAEGVETNEQLRFLRAKGCDQIQGYYFSRPVPAAEFESMLRNDKHLELEPDSVTDAEWLLPLTSKGTSSSPASWHHR
ncbi:EAL domain-containing protein [Chitinivorax sp. B]|uniref:two-component system response regulator n=1 Tax=Chitinivorax sp. B TaxID=2502235 RepID=UPI0010F6041D|nr:EAL domain-containing protein [Chitinivorax sp. B]